jgi:pimeloyl-ACP methyl ester carboxylesterase
MLLGVSIPPSVRLPSGVDPARLSGRHGELAALRAGPAGRPDVLLVPGFTGSKEDFLPILPLLAERGWTAWAIDQHGQYQSTGPEEDASYSLSGWADDVAALARAAEGLHVVGHSFGGLVCREAAIEDPAAFRSLTLLDSGPGALPERHHHRLALLAGLIPQWSLEQIWQAKEQLERADGVPPPPPQVQAFLHRRWVHGSPGALKAMAQLLTNCPDRVADLRIRVDAGLAVRVAYGVGDDTSWDPYEFDDMARRLGVEAAVIPDAAHSPAVENPGFTADLLDTFFRSVG